MEEKTLLHTKRYTLLKGLQAQSVIRYFLVPRSDSFSVCVCRAEGEKNEEELLDNLPSRKGAEEFLLYLYENGVAPQQAREVYCDLERNGWFRYS